MRTSIWVGLGIFVIVLLVLGEILIHRAGPILKGRVEETLSARFDSRAQLDNLEVSLFRGLEVSGSGVRIYSPDADHPLIAVQSFSFHSGLMGLFVKPMHVSKVLVTGLQIDVPPKRTRPPNTARDRVEKADFVVDEIVCSDSRLTIESSRPDKDPKIFELRQIDLHNVGPTAPWRYDATITNALPRGDIHATGTFGPWQTGSPGDAAVTGHYTFDRADLGTIKGISGTLSSVGDFKGQLNKIVIDGTTETPDFALDIAQHALPLHTRFHATVDGTTGDTYLQPVSARLRNSAFTTSGAVIGIKGQGHRIDLDVVVPDAQLRDFLDLAVKTTPAVMTGLIATKTKLQIKPGRESVSEKLTLSGDFALHRIQFTNPDVQDKVDMLSLRAQGDPKDAKPGAADVDSRMKGRFQMADRVIRFSDLAYVLPGAEIDLNGNRNSDWTYLDITRTNGMRFRDKVCLVTGAGSGIGKAICLRFASEHGKVVVVDVNPDHGNQTVAEITGAGGEAIFAQCDVSQEQEVENAVNAAVTKWGKLDVLVNDAAMMTFEDVIDLKVSDWDRVIAVNLRSVFLFCHYALPHMKRGAIVNISSVHAHETEPGVAPYAASKGAMEAFTRALCRELEEPKVRVNCVAPGAIDTPMLWNNPNVKSGKEKIEGAVGKPEDIAAAVAFLASDEARFITGTTLVVDGGRLDIL